VFNKKYALAANPAKGLVRQPRAKYYWPAAAAKLKIRDLYTTSLQLF